MAEEKPTSKSSGWIKAGLTSALGLFSGAVLMYVSPLVNSAIKPSKPVPNFAQQVQGLSVVFQNRSVGGSAGWWDFGDGSALEPFNAQQESIAHTYPRPGTYTAKLTLKNFIGDETDRSVVVTLDGSSANAPVIETFQIVPMGPEIAPATYRVVSKVKNADLAIFSMGDDRPFEVNNDSSSQDRVVTLKDPGAYKLRLVAVSGKQSVEQAKDLWVGVGDFSAPGATLQVTYDAIRVEKLQKEVNVSAAFPADRKENTYAFKEERRVDGGFQIVEAKFARPVKDAAVRNAKVEISSDKTKIVVSGELVKPTGIFNKNAPPPNWAATVTVAMERRSEMARKSTDPVMVNLSLPGVVTLPLPSLPIGWEPRARQLSLEVSDGGKTVLRESKLPIIASVQLKNRPCRITAIEQSGQIRLEVSDAAKTLRTIPK